MILHIKNMVCHRCVMAVDQLLKELNFTPVRIELGEVEINSDLSADDKKVLGDRLRSIGFELIDDKQSRIITQVKSLIIREIHHSEHHQNINWSDLISGALPYEYKYLSRLFSSVEGITIEQYIIRQKIEKVKELIIYDELSLSQIAYKLDYSSVAHLSSQFKKVTGMTPSEFKKLGIANRKPLDRV